MGYGQIQLIDKIWLSHTITFHLPDFQALLSIKHLITIVLPYAIITISKIINVM